MLGINDYDDQGNLRPGLLIPFLILYLGRYLLYGPISMLASRGNFSYDINFLAIQNPFLFVTSVPPIFLGFLLLAKRLPKDSFRHFVWQGGREVLLVTSLVQFSVSLIFSLLDKKLGPLIFLSHFFDLVVIFIIVKSYRISIFFSSTNHRST